MNVATVTDLLDDVIRGRLHLGLLQGGSDGVLQSFIGHHLKFIVL